MDAKKSTTLTSAHNPQQRHGRHGRHGFKAFHDTKRKSASKVSKVWKIWLQIQKVLTGYGAYFKSLYLV